MIPPSTTPAADRGVTVRAATPGDIDLVMALVRDLAVYEKLDHLVDATPDMMAAALFGPSPRVFCEIVEWRGEPAGMAIWFYNFSTFRGRHGIYLEDLFVRPSLRGHGLGRVLLRSLAQRCIREELTRLEWSVLDWNAPAIAFYRSQGAALLHDWTTCRLSGPALANLGAEA